VLPSFTFLKQEMTNFCIWLPTGRRYLRSGGDGEVVHPEKCKDVGNRLRFAHALWAVPALGARFVGGDLWSTTVP